MKSIMALYLMVSMALFSVVVNADDEERLLISCQALNKSQVEANSQLCRYYLYGFLAGALAIDTVNSIERTEDVKKLSAFLERAYRTRIGEIDNREKSTQFMHFCLPESESKAAVIVRLSSYLQHPIETMAMLQTTVYNALNTEYPCRANLSAAS